MDTTPVHSRLWHRDFWLLAIASFLLTMPMYMLIPLLPSWLEQRTDLPYSEVAMVMLSYGLGLFALGPLCNYLTQRYRRKTVCVLSSAGVAILLSVFFVLEHSLGGWALPWYALAALRFVLGALFGLSQMVLLSTLIIDVSESAYRTEANYAVVWFGRFPLVLGPLVALQLYRFFDIDIISLIMAATALLGALLVCMIHLPFKAPDDNLRTLSTDRFLLKENPLCFINLMCFTAFFGMLLYWMLDAVMYAMLMVGFYLAIRLGKTLLSVSGRRADMYLAFALSGLAFLLPILFSNEWLWNYLSPVLFGCVAGLVCNRFMFIFLNISHHCQRGTSQSTFFLAWELGITLGVFLTFMSPDMEQLLLIALSLLALSFVLYFTLTHGWQVRHQNRQPGL